MKTKKVKIQSDDEETEGEIVEGDVHFDTSLDEGMHVLTVYLINYL